MITNILLKCIIDNKCVKCVLSQGYLRSLFKKE